MNRKIHSIGAGFQARLAAVVAVAAIAMGFLQVAPASADTTTVTFTLATGALAIDNAETAVTLASENTVLGSTASGSLGEITVTDTRNLSVGWIASGATTDFTQTPAATPANPAISKLQATITQASTMVSNTNVTSFVGTAATGVGGPIGTAVAVGSNSATFAPTISVIVPPGTATGTYTGTFTSTVV